LQLGQGLVDAFLRESVDVQAFNDLVLATSQVTGKPNTMSFECRTSLVKECPW
jgi:hypothetical protein